MYFLKLGGDLRALMKPVHKRLGLLCVILGFSTLCLGIQEKTDQKSLEGDPLQMTYALEIFLYFTIGCIIFTVSKFNDKSDTPQPNYDEIKASVVPLGDNKDTMTGAPSGGQYNSLYSERDSFT